MIKKQKISVFIDGLHSAILDYQGEIIVNYKESKEKNRMLDNVARAFEMMDRIKTYMQNAETIEQELQK